MKHKNTLEYNFRRVLQKALVACLALCLGIVSALPKDDLSVIPAGNWRLVDSLQRGTSISVRMTPGDRIEGEFLALDSDSVRLVVDKRERMYPRNSIVEIRQLHVPDPKMNGTLIGMAAGAGVGLIAAAAGGFLEPTGDTAANQWKVGFILGGIGLGAVFGFTADALINGDKIIYRK